MLRRCISTPRLRSRSESDRLICYNILRQGVEKLYRKLMKKNTASKQESSVARNVIIYGIGGVLSQAAGLITLPLMTRCLSSLEYGSIEVITSLTGYFNLLIGLNMMTGLYRFFFQADDDLDRREMVSTTFLFVALCGLIVILISFLSGDFFSQYLFKDSSHTQLIRLAFIALVPVAVYVYSLNLLRLENKALPYMIIALTVSLIYMGCIILFVAVFKTGIPGYYYAQIISNTIGIGIALFISRELLAPRFSFKWFKRLARYSLPLVPGTLFGWSLSANNRMFLNAATTPVQVAYYGLANKATIVITLATQAFCNAWEPTMYSLLNREEKIKRTLPVMLSLYTFGTLSICTLVMTVAREIFLFLAPPEYLAGIGLLGIMQLRWIFTMGVYVIDPGSAKSGKTWWVSVMLGLAVLVNLGANTILTPRLGLYGAVISELLGYVTAMCGRWIVSDRLFPISWKLRYFITMIILYGAAAYGQTRIILSDLPWMLSFLLRLLLAAAVIGGGYVMIDSEAKLSLAEIIQNARKKVWKKRTA